MEIISCLKKKTTYNSNVQQIHIKCINSSKKEIHEKISYKHAGRNMHNVGVCIKSLKIILFPKHVYVRIFFFPKCHQYLWCWSIAMLSSVDSIYFDQSYSVNIDRSTHIIDFHIITKTKLECPLGPKKCNDNTFVSNKQTNKQTKEPSTDAV